MTDPRKVNYHSGTSAVDRLARIADQLADRELSSRRFLRGLAWNCAGIRPDIRGYLDLASGGSDFISGRGFRWQFDDKSDGQVRHFAGVVVAPVLLGRPLTWLAHRWVLKDGPDSADGRLSAEAIRFSNAIRSGRLPHRDAGAWIRRNLS